MTSPSWAWRRWKLRDARRASAGFENQSVVVRGESCARGPGLGRQGRRPGFIPASGNARGHRQPKREGLKARLILDRAFSPRRRLPPNLGLRPRLV
jgi:hypothetical protein